MSDLTFHPFAICLDQLDFEVRIGNYFVTFNQHNRGKYTYNWHCQCKGFQFRGSCKHVTEAKDKQCQFDQFHDGNEPVNGKCPCCGKKVEYQNIAV